MLDTEQKEGISDSDAAESYSFRKDLRSLEQQHLTSHFQK